MAGQRTVLLTGATGFLGARILERIPPNISVLLLKSSTTGSEYCGHKVCTLKQLTSEPVDFIIHTAASVKGSAKTQQSSNVALTEDLVDLARSKKSAFLFISSLNVKLDHKGLYEKTKMQAEKIVTQKLDNYLIIRPSYLFSADSEPNLEPLLQFAWLLKMIRFSVFPPFKVYLQPLDVDELAAFIVKQIDSARWEKKDIVEAGGPDKIELLTMIENFLQFHNIHCHLYYLPALFKFFFTLPGIEKRTKVFFQDKVVASEGAFIGRTHYHGVAGEEGKFVSGK